MSGTADTQRVGLGRLRNKSVVVTGAASGIGRAAAELFALEGARLFLNDRDADGLEALSATLREQGAEVGTVAGDIAAEDTVRALVSGAVDAYGRLDGMFANAGVIPEMPLAEATAEAWDRAMAVNGRGTFLSCKYAAAAMMKTGGGAIVCTSSISGQAGQPGQSIYGPSKFVATGLVKHLAIELAREGIRVNGVAPGTIETPPVRKMPREQRDRLDAAHPVGRIGQPVEVAYGALFLLSDEASFITGAILPVDGGYMAQ